MIDARLGRPGQGYGPFGKILRSTKAPLPAPVQMINDHSLGGGVAKSEPCQKHSYVLGYQITLRKRDGGRGNASVHFSVNPLAQAGVADQDQSEGQTARKRPLASKEVADRRGRKPLSIVDDDRHGAAADRFRRKRAPSPDERRLQC